MNWQKVFRYLVTECHMSYREILDLTPRQISAILCTQSDPPGLLQLETIREIKEGLRRHYGI